MIGKILKATSSISLSTGVVFFCSFLRNKIFALLLGVTGMGVVSQLNNFITLMNNFVPLGIPNGLSKFVAEENITEEEKLRRIFFTSLNLVALPTIFFSIVLFLFSKEFSFFLFQTYEYDFYLKIVSISIPVLILSSMLEGYVRGLKVIHVYSKFIIISNLAGLGILVPLTFQFGITGAICGIVATPLVYILTSYIFFRKAGLLKRPRFVEKFDRSLLKKLLKVSFAFLISGTMFQVTFLLIRKIIINDLGIYYNGIYQSVLGISISYFGFIFLFLSVYTFPTISKYVSEVDIVNELNVNVRYIMIMMVPLVTFVLCLRSLIVPLLFSKEFSSSEQLFAYQFTGDYFKSLAWSIGIWFIPKMRLKAFLILDVILNFNLVVLFYFFQRVFGFDLIYASVAYLIAYVIHFILNYIVSRSLIKYNFTREISKLFILSLVILISITILSYLYYYIAIAVAIPLMVFWIFTTLKKEERIEIKGFILKSLKIG